MGPAGVHSLPVRPPALHGADSPRMFPTMAFEPRSRNTPFAPTVLYPLTLPALLNHVLTTQAGAASTTLVICASRDTFIQNLSQSIQEDQINGQSGALQNLVTPTLHNLLTTRRVKLAFCTSVQALLAYLTAYGRAGIECNGEAGGRERLVLVNPLELHAPTPSFSAQGLSRTFAAATDTALRTGAILHVVECPTNRRDTRDHDNEPMDEMDESGVEHADTNEHKTDEDPWEQEVSILNVSARRFGSGSADRAWAGRTVKTKRIAARWFRFHKLDSSEVRVGLG